MHSETLKFYYGLLVRRSVHKMRQYAGHKVNGTDLNTQKLKWR